MKTVQLVNGINSSVLGFGCAPILGSVDAKKAKDALDFALECGITHLDLARSYGFGEAEEFVGKVIKGRRNNIVIASKFGIKANWKAKLLSPLKPAVRFLKSKVSKGSAAPVTIVSAPASNATVADRFHDRIEMRAASMKNSLEQSLKALNTDHLDYLFVHEPLTMLTHIDELSEAARVLKAEGKIRAFGLAVNRSQMSLHHDYLSRFDVLQFDNSPGAIGYADTVKERGQLANVIFSPFRGGSKDIAPKEKLKTLMMEFPKTVILCSMYDKKHILENVKIANE